MARCVEDFERTVSRRSVRMETRWRATVVSVGSSTAAVSIVQRLSGPPVKASGRGPTRRGCSRVGIGRALPGLCPRWTPRA
eukprot:7586868-Lingulodinium_polyedra.AAC.1